MGTRMMRSLWTVVVLAAMPSAAGDAPLRKVADIPLGGAAVRFDYQSFDRSDGRLYIAHMDANQLVVFDTRKREVVATLDGFPRVHGVWVVPEENRVYASITGAHKVAAVERSTLRTVITVGPIDYPDGLAYATGYERLFVSDERGKADAVIDVRHSQLLKSIALGGEAGNAVFDQGAGRILVAVHEKNELAAIDPSSLKITGHYPVPGVEHPHGVALDAVNRRAFVAGEQNHMLALMDLISMKVLATYPVGEDPDVLAFDPGLGLLYVAAESGDVTVFREDGDRLVPLGGLHMPHAHSVCVDPDTHLVYFPLEDVDGRTLLRIMEPVERPR